MQCKHAAWLLPHHPTHIWWTTAALSVICDWNHASGVDQVHIIRVTWTHLQRLCYDCMLHRRVIALGWDRSMIFLYVLYNSRILGNELHLLRCLSTIYGLHCSALSVKWIMCVCATAATNVGAWGRCMFNDVIYKNNTAAAHFWIRCWGDRVAWVCIWFAAMSS